MELQGNAVLIKPDKALERTDKGILIPIATKDKTSTGVVVAVGPECETVRPRMKVTFNRKGASVQTIEGEDFLLTNEMPGKIFYMEWPLTLEEEIKRDRYELEQMKKKLAERKKS